MHLLFKICSNVFSLGREVSSYSWEKVRKEHGGNKTMITWSQGYLCWHPLPPKSWGIADWTKWHLSFWFLPQSQSSMTEPKDSLDTLRDPNLNHLLETTQWEEEIQESHFMAIYPLSLTYMIRWCHNKDYLLLCHRVLLVFFPIIPNLAQWATGWDRDGTSQYGQS